MSRVIGAEWVKLRSVRSTWWCLAATLVLMMGGSLVLGASRATDMMREGVTGAHFAASEPVVSATMFTQFTLIALAMLVITSEYASGGIRTTLQATPIRGLVLAAKALVVVPVMFAVAVVAGGLSTVAVYMALSADIFGDYAVLAPGEVAYSLVSMGLFFALVAVMTIGVGTAMRSAAGTLTVMFMLVLGFPLMLVMTGSPLALDISLRMPLFAGLALMDSTDNLTGGPMPYGAGEGLVWLLAWTAAALVAGYAVLRHRDA